MLRCIIVDDERIILNELCELAQKCGITVCGAYQNPKTALSEIDETQPDAAFLDIEMPEINGIELAEKFREKNIRAVFITAYKEHAVKAFGVNAIHYLLKPVRERDFIEAAERIREANEIETGLGTVQSATLIKNSNGVYDRISVKDREDVTVIKIADILYITSQSGVTSVTTKKGSYSSRKGLQFWEENLDGAGFLRCHKSYIVNTDFISKMVNVLGEYKELELNYGDVRIPISRRKAPDVKKWLGVT